MTDNPNDYPFRVVDLAGRPRGYYRDMTLALRASSVLPDSHVQARASTGAWAIVRKNTEPVEFGRPNR